MVKKVREIKWGSVIVASFIPAMAQLMWLVYNSYVPLWLQAGNPTFEMSEGVVLYGFGYGAFVTGLLLTLDNVAGLFLTPLVGMISDGTRTRWGRRKPWIVLATPVAIIAFMLIPFLALRVPAELNGQTQALTPYFVPFFLSLVFMMLPLAIIEAPSLTIVFDISPSKHRTTVNAIACVAGSVASVVGAIMMSILFDISPVMPFVVGGLLTLVIIIFTMFFVKEPEQVYEEGDEVSTKVSMFNLKTVFQALRALKGDYLKSLILILISMFVSYVAFGQIQSFLTSYNVSILKMDPATASMVYAVAGGSFLLGAAPAALLPRKLKRKGTVLIGLLVYAVISLVVYFVTSVSLIWIFVGIAAFFWSFVNINMDVMLLDSAPDDTLLGTYNGLMVFAKTAGFIIGPLVGGFVVEKFGNTYNNIWLVMVVFMIISILTILPVKRGEVRSEETQTALDAQPAE